MLLSAKIAHNSTKKYNSFYYNLNYKKIQNCKFK